MLAPDTRSVAVELLRPPTGYRLDRAVLTTYSLDLDALLALPLAVLAHSDGDVEMLLEDPLLILEALRQAGERITVFVDHGGIANPGKARNLYAMLEASVVPVRAPGGGVFHPKVWVARFLDENDDPLLRVSVLSRNLTYDRSWDIALASEAAPHGRRRHRATAPLADLIRGLSGMATEDLPRTLADSLNALADEVAITHFPVPDGFADFIKFEVLGLHGPTRRPWRPPTSGSRLLAISPFVRKAALDAFAEVADQELILVSRQDELDALPDGALDGWDAYVLNDGATDETDDASSPRPSGLHAKLYVVEHGHDVTWSVGSANLTAAGTRGTNVEFMASVTGKRGRLIEAKGGQGINRFLEAGFEELMVEYERHDRDAVPEAVVQGRQNLREAEQVLLNADLNLVCVRDGGGEHWNLSLDGSVALPAGVQAQAWPLSLKADNARSLPLPLTWNDLPTTRLTAFFAFRLTVAVDGVDAIEWVRKLPASGFPQGRVSQVLRLLIDSPERLIQFLKALLGGLEGLASDFDQDDTSAGAGRWGGGLGGDTLLEDLVRMASRDPDRLEPVRRLIQDLRQSDEGRKIVPDALYAVWQAVDAAVGGAK